MSTDSVFAPLNFPSLPTGVATEELDRARTRGHAAGYAEGLRKAASDAAVLEAAAREDQAARAEATRLAVAAALRALGSAADQFAALTAPVLEESDAALAAAAIDLAEAVLCRELDDSAASARSALHRALAVVAPEEIIAVRLNPEDLALIDPATAHGVRLVADGSIERGDALVDVPSGSVDARIATALDRARRVLVGGSR